MVPGKRSKWTISGAAKVKGEDGFELFEARASKRRAKQECQREIERERVGREAKVKEEGKRDRLLQHQALAKAVQERRDEEARRAAEGARGSLGAMAGLVEPCEGVGVDWLGEEGDSRALGERLVGMEELAEGRVLLDEDVGGHILGQQEGGVV